MDTMICGGFSVIGSYHDTNQDAFWAGKVSPGYLAVVSDGVGSCRFSGVGSKQLVKTVRELLEVPDISGDNANAFAVRVEENWKHSIGEHGYEISDCSATALIAIWLEDSHSTWLLRLGDGAVTAVFPKEPVTLCDTKEGRFVNMTDSLGASYTPWEVKEITEEIPKAVFLWTDGVSSEVEKEEIQSMARGLYEEYSGQPEEMIEKDLSVWIPGLPGRDDKTLAFMIRR